MADPKKDQDPNSSGSSDDKDFDPTVEMMLQQDIDDERTLDEEEELDQEDANLEDLNAEGDMPLEELLKMYGYPGYSADTSATSETNEAERAPTEERSASVTPPITLPTTSPDAQTPSVPAEPTDQQTPSQTSKTPSAELQDMPESREKASKSDTSEVSKPASSEIEQKSSDKPSEHPVANSGDGGKLIEQPVVNSRDGGKPSEHPVVNSGDGGKPIEQPVANSGDGGKPIEQPGANSGDGDKTAENPTAPDAGTVQPGGDADAQPVVESSMEKQPLSVNQTADASIDSQVTTPVPLAHEPTQPCCQVPSSVPEGVSSGPDGVATASGSQTPATVDETPVPDNVTQPGVNLTSGSQTPVPGNATPVADGVSPVPDGVTPATDGETPMQDCETSSVGDQATTVAPETKSTNGDSPSRRVSDASELALAIDEGSMAASERDSPQQPTDTHNSDSEADKNVVTRNTLALLYADDSEIDTESDDSDYSEELNWKKSINVGSVYQAQIPDGLSHYTSSPPYENKDTLLWQPSCISRDELETYVSTANCWRVQCSETRGQIPSGYGQYDSEQALQILLESNGNSEEAMRRLKKWPFVDAGQVPWSEDECQDFEKGLRIYGKDFFKIHHNKVRSRSVQQIVEFYYMWKKTERHDYFVASLRQDKFKYQINPGISDYMDRLLDELENPTNANTCNANGDSSPALRSSSPNASVPNSSAAAITTSATSPATGNSTTHPPATPAAAVTPTAPSQGSTGNSSSAEKRSAPRSASDQASDPKQPCIENAAEDDNVFKPVPVNRT